MRRAASVQLPSECSVLVSTSSLYSARNEASPSPELSAAAAGRAVEAANEEGDEGEC